MLPEERRTMVRTIGLVIGIFVLMIFIGSVFVAVRDSRSDQKAVPTPTPTQSHSVAPTVSNTPSKSASEAMAAWFSSGGGTLINDLHFDISQIAEKGGKSDVAGTAASCHYLAYDVQTAQEFQDMPDMEAQGYWSEYLKELSLWADACIAGTKGGTMDSVDPALIEQSSSHIAKSDEWIKKLNKRIGEL